MKKICYYFFENVMASIKREKKNIVLSLWTEISQHSRMSPFQLWICILLKNTAVALKQCAKPRFVYTQTTRIKMRGKNAVETLILQWKSYEYSFHNTLNHFKGQVSSTCLKINIFYVLWHMVTFESLCLLTCVCISRFSICNSSFITDRD